MLIDHKSNFAPHPVTDVPVRAVIVDVTEPRLTKTSYGDKMKFAIVFETELKKDDGTHWVVWDHGYTPSMDEKSTLRKNLVKMMGTTSLPVPFDTESLIGMPARIMITHAQSDGKTYANIGFYAPEKSNNPLSPSGKYVRQRDRDKTDTGASYEKAAEAPEEKAGWQQTKVHVGRFKGQELENLDAEAIQNLITHWLPTVTAADAKPTADDRRLITALTEAEKVLGAQAAPSF